MAHTFALSFKGGLAWGFGAIGLIRFLEEHNLKPQLIAGSSSGAMVATLCAMGKSWKEMLDSVFGFNFLAITSLSSLIREGSIVNYNKYRQVFLNFNQGNDLAFNDLPTKLVIFATDPFKRERVYIEKGSVVEALLASSGYPPIFPVNKKVEGFRGHILVDGDFTVGYSVPKLKAMGVDKVVGVRFNDFLDHKSVEGNLMLRLLTVPKMLSMQVEKLNDEAAFPDFEFAYHSGSYGRFDFRHLDKLVQSTYITACRKEKEILSALGAN